MKKIGKGTGRYADRHRRQARKYMQEARGAVPVWIMPVYRVLENFLPGAERFDAVIVDESSQSDIFTLSILFKAEKAVIVGDSNQISPEAVGIEQSQVHELIDRYLQGIPQATRFDLQTRLKQATLAPGLFAQTARAQPTIALDTHELTVTLDPEDRQISSRRSFSFAGTLSCRSGPQKTIREVNRRGRDGDPRGQRPHDRGADGRERGRQPGVPPGALLPLKAPASDQDVYDVALALGDLHADPPAGVERQTLMALSAR